MSKGKMRPITVDNIRYVWNRRHHDKKQYERYRCVEIVTVYLAERKTGPLRVYFHLDHMTSAAMGSLFDPFAGTVSTQHSVINFNRPGVIAVLIQHARSIGWQPETAKQPFHIDRGADLLNQLSFPSEVIFEPAQQSA